MAAGKSLRAQLKAVAVEHLPGEQCRARVTLARRLGAHLDQTFVGLADGEWSPAGELRCAAAAALKALERSFGTAEGTFTAVDVKTVESFDCPAVIIAVRAEHAGETHRFTGFCEVRGDPPLAAAKAALNGTNRFVSYRLT